MEWEKIKAEYLAGGTSYRKLCLKYGLTLATLRSVAKREEWVKLKAQAQHKADTKIVNAVSNKAAKKAVDIIDVADKLLGKISELMEDMVVDTQSLKQLTSALKDLKEIKGFKSDADMREQEARIRNLEKQAEADNNNDREIKVFIEGSLDNYSK